MQKMSHYTNSLFLFLLFHTYTMHANSIAIVGCIFGANVINGIIQLWFPDESHLQMQREFSVSSGFVKHFFPCQELGVKKLLEQAAKKDLENMKALHMQQLLEKVPEQYSEQEQDELLRNIASNLLTTYHHYNHCCNNEFSDQQHLSIKYLADTLYNELRTCLHKNIIKINSTKCATLPNKNGRM